MNQEVKNLTEKNKGTWKNNKKSAVFEKKFS